MNASRVALVTGSGAKRVGSVVADALARRGYAIAVHYRSSATEAADTAWFVTAGSCTARASVHPSCLRCGARHGR